MREQRVVENFVVVVRQFGAEMQIGVEQMIARRALSRIVLVAIAENLLGAPVVQDVRTWQRLQRVVLQAVGLAAQTTVQAQRVLSLSG